MQRGGALKKMSHLKERIGLRYLFFLSGSNHDEGVFESEPQILDWGNR